MKKTKILALAISALFCSATAFAQRGYSDAPYTRYEADAGSGSGPIQSSYDQGNIASEASGRTCVKLSGGNSREWTSTAKFRGIVVRASSGTEGGTGKAKLYVGGSYVTTLSLEDSYGWKHMNDNAQNYTGINNGGSRMRFQEARYLLSSSQNAGTKIKIEADGTLYLDFVEAEDVAGEISCPSGYTKYTGNGSNLQSWLDSNGGNVYIPAGTYNVSGCINVGSRIIQGAGMWYTKLVWNGGSTGNLGLCSYSKSTQIKDLSMDNTGSKSRSNNHKGFNGVWGRIENCWVTHFECGAWFGNYNGGYGDAVCDGMVVKGCRFRYNYADGVNLCQGSKNCNISHCDFRANGDDDMAIWPASDAGRGNCTGNTYEYCTAEFCWFASSVACYGGGNNTWHDIVIRDNREVGIRINGRFPGYGFASGNKMYNIDVIRCGTWKDSYSNPVGAVDITGAGSNINSIGPVALSCIDITDAGSDAVWVQGGTSFNNLTLCGFTVNGTGKEGTSNDNGNKGSWGYGYAFRGVSNPNGVSYNQNTFSASNLGGSAGSNAYRDWGNVTNNTGISCSCAKVDVTGVTVNPTSKEIGIGEVTTITATVLPAGASNKSVTWSSNNTNVATVDENGNVTGKAAGSATITVKTQDGNFTATCAITVKTIAVTGIAFENNTATVAIGGTATVKANVKPSNATNQGVTYSITSGSDKASVNASTGIVTGKAAGTAIVTATSAEGNYTATCTVTVVACTPVSGVDLEPIELTMNPANPKVGDKVYFTAVVRNNGQNTNTTGFGVVFWLDGATTYSAGSGKQYWCDSKKGNGAVNMSACGTDNFTSNGGDNSVGYWTATEGNHSLRIQVDDGSAVSESNEGNNELTVQFTVSNTPQPTVKSVTVSPSNPSATVGQTINLTATVEVENGAAQTVTWSSSNNNIKVNNGAVTATAAGTATITATSTVDNSKKGTATVTFTAANVPVTGVTISANPTDIKVGGTSTLSSTVSPNNATNKNVTYSIVSGPGTINNNVVTATGAGDIVVKVTTADGGKTDEITIKSTNVAVSSVTISSSANTVLVGGQVTLSATISPSNATNKNVTYSVVSGPGTISGDKLTATGKGTIVVKVTTADGNKTSQMEITATDCDATGAVDLVIEDIDWYPRNNIKNGDHVTFVITVKNQGGTALSKTSKLGVVVEIDGPRDYSDKSNTYVWSDYYKNNNLPADIQPCGTMILETNGGDSGVGYWTANGTQHTIYAKVDDSGLITEKNENNNEFTKSLALNTSTEIENIEDNGITISVEGNAAKVIGAEMGDNITVFSILGVKEKSIKATGDVEFIELPAGVHVVRVANKVAEKIMIAK